MGSSMRYGSICALTAIAAVVALAVPVGAAHAQSAAEITKALMPTGPVSATTRGIKPIAPGTVGASASVASTSPRPREIDLNVRFATGSAELTPTAEATLNQLGKALTGQALVNDTFKIVGHTDTVGSPAANLTLSRARADSVKTYLEDKFGITQSRLEASGVGEADPAVSTPPQTPNARNRRVQVINVSG